MLLLVRKVQSKLINLLFNVWGIHTLTKGVVTPLLFDGPYGSSVGRERVTYLDLDACAVALERRLVGMPEKTLFAPVLPSVADNFTTGWR